MNLVFRPRANGRRRLERRQAGFPFACDVWFYPLRLDSARVLAPGVDLHSRDVVWPT